MFWNCYPGRDEQLETDASFRAMIDAIPATVKRRWGYRVVNLQRQMDEECEIERLVRWYTPAAVKSVESYDDEGSDLEDGGDDGSANQV